MEQESTINNLPSDLIGVITSLLSWKEVNMFRLCAKQISTNLLWRHLPICEIDTRDPTRIGFLKAVKKNAKELKSLSTIKIHLSNANPSREEIELVQSIFKEVEPQILQLYISDPNYWTTSQAFSNLFMPNRSIMQVLHIDESLDVTWVEDLFSSTSPSWPALTSLRLKLHVEPNLLQKIAESCSNLQELCLFASFDNYSWVGARHVGESCNAIRALAQANPRLRRFQVAAIDAIPEKDEELVLRQSFEFLAGKDGIFDSHEEWGEFSDRMMKRTGLPISAFIIDVSPAWRAAFSNMFWWTSVSSEALDALSGLFRQCHPNQSYGQFILWLLYCSYSSGAHNHYGATSDVRLALSLWTLQRIEEVLDQGELWMFSRGFHGRGVGDLTVIVRDVCQFLIIERHPAEHLERALKILKRILLLEESFDLENCIKNPPFEISDTDGSVLSQIIVEIENDSEFMKLWENSAGKRRDI